MEVCGGRYGGGTGFWSRIPKGLAAADQWPILVSVTQTYDCWVAVWCPPEKPSIKHGGMIIESARYLWSWKCQSRKVEPAIGYYQA